MKMEQKGLIRRSRPRRLLMASHRSYRNQVRRKFVRMMPVTVLKLKISRTMLTRMRAALIMDQESNWQMEKLRSMMKIQLQSIYEVQRLLLEQTDRPRRWLEGPEALRWAFKQIWRAAPEVAKVPSKCTVCARVLMKQIWSAATNVKNGSIFSASALAQ